jgi:hypothetical protein
MLCVGAVTALLLGAPAASDALVAPSGDPVSHILAPLQFGTDLDLGRGIRARGPGRA